MSGISAASLAGIQQGLQLFNEASARVSAASQNNNTEDLTSGILDMKDAQLQIQATVNSFSGGDETFQSVIDLFV